jgi:hypothetical protein
MSETTEPGPQSQPSPETEPSSESEPGRAEKSKSAFSRPRVRLGAIVAIAIAAGFVVWLFVDSRDDTSSSTRATATGTTFGGPAALSESELEDLSTTLQQPIYWAGTKDGYSYEVTRTTDGRVYVRYLPPGTEVGDSGANHLIVVTYPFPKAYRAVNAVAGGNGIKLPGGGLALVDKGHPKSVHLAFRGVNYQVEVYDPVPSTSLSVAVSGNVRPVGKSSTTD